MADGTCKGKRVIIVGMLSAYPDAKPGDEVWGVNCTYWHQKNLTRLFFFDPLEQWPPERSPEEFCAEVNALGIPVVTRFPVPEIPRSVAYPLQEIVEEFGVVYFSSTICFMLAQAIYEGASEIVLHDIHCLPSAMKYLDQKACLDFWCGVALGRGIRLSLSEGCALAQPYPWDTPLYGYLRSNVQAMNIGLMNRAYTLSLLPVRFTPVDGAGDFADAVLRAPSRTVARHPSTREVEEVANVRELPRSDGAGTMAFVIEPPTAAAGKERA